MYASACISLPLHLSLIFLLLARSCLPLYQRCSLEAGTPSIFTDFKFLCLSPPPPHTHSQPSGKKKKKLPVFPSAHTYIHKHVFMEARGKRTEGSGIRITLNSKQRIVGPWRADGQSASQPATQAEAHTGVTHRPRDR